MPRFSNPETHEFWQIERDGDLAFRTTFGALGKPGASSKKTWPDAARATAEYDKLIAFKQARGFTLDGAPRAKKPSKAAPVARGPARNPALEALIAKGDDKAFEVYGDWLTEQEDPRGTLIALHRKRGQAAAASRWIDEHREHFLGSLHEISEEMMQLTWRNGFVDAVRFERVSGGADDEERTLGKLARALLDHPSGAFLRSLTIGTGDGIADGMIDYESIPRSIAPAPHLEAISIGDWREWEVSWSKLGDASGFWKLPRLATLVLRVGSMKLGTIASTSLRTLQIITGGLTKANIKSLVTAKLPALETLDLYFGSHNYGASGGVADLAPLLAGNTKSFAKLRRLGLKNAEFTDELCAALARSPLLRQLTSLDLSLGTMSSAGARALAANKKAFAHLDELNVSNNFLGAADVASLKGLAKKLVSNQQRSDEERYVALGE